VQNVRNSLESKVKNNGEKIKKHEVNLTKNHLYNFLTMKKFSVQQKLLGKEFEGQ